MQATMMDRPLSVQMILEHGQRLHRDAAVKSYDGTQIRSTPFAQIAEDVGALAVALERLGIQAGDRVATFCWNHTAHLTAYLAVPSMGAVLHTLNVRLFPEQVAHIMRHAGDRYLIIDAGLLPQIAEQLTEVPSLETIIVVGQSEDQPIIADIAQHSYETLLATQRGQQPQWPTLDERAAAVCCYTSGTTGDPKGIVYSHRSIFLHTLGTLGRDTFGIGQDDRILLLPSMFHANAWGLPYSAWFAGADLILPGPHLGPAHLRQMIAAEHPTFTATVPTVLNDLLQADLSEPLDLSCFRVILSGGSPVSPTLVRRIRERWNVPVLQGWGMTETSPMCCLSIPPKDCSEEESIHYRSLAGRPVPGMQVRIVDQKGRPTAEDGRTVGELQLRGPWVTGSYHQNASVDSFTEDGWLRTGDVGCIDARGYVQITDRTKDVIKSGGEWVSSVDLENQLCAHSAISEVAVIGIPDPRWEERPLAIVVPRQGQQVEPAELRRFLEDKVARFWLPEYWCIAASLPRTSVGKIDKKALRSAFAEQSLQVIQLR